MAEKPQQVLDFLDSLAKRSKTQGEKELAELLDFCQTQFGVNELEAWDIAFTAKSKNNTFIQLMMKNYALTSLKIVY